MHSRNRNIVVTGCEAITPAGYGLEALWDAVVNARACGEALTDWDLSGNATRIGAPIRDFDPLRHGMSAADTQRLDRACQFAVAAARGAWSAAGIDGGRVDLRRVGVCIGSAIGGIGFMEREYVRLARAATGQPGQPPALGAADPRSYGGFLAFSISSEVATNLGACGPVTTMATGCTAGLDAIGAAGDMIASGMADIVVTGGVDAPLTPIVLTSFDNIKALTRRNHDPRHASRPFDRDRDGFLLAEGCGVLVLEEETHARRRGAPILGRVLGFSSLSNAYHMTSLAADGEALASTIGACLQAARVNAGDIDYVNAHGSSTKQNDRNETAAFKRVLGDRAWRVPISSNKSVLGHSLGAASAIETIICLQSLQRGVVPPTANYENPSEDCDLDYVPNVAREYRLRTVECNASGFSGIHSALLLGHADRRPA